MPTARKRALRVLAAIAALGAVSVAGCGGDDGPSNEEFVSQANAICERHTERIEAAASEALAGGELPDPREFGKVAQQTIIPEITAQVEELRELEPPDEAADEYDRFVDSAEQARRRLEQDPSRITNAANFQDVNQQADELGLSQSCHIGPG